jgi:uncharacterized protein YjbI with pentapeptide repeats
MSDFNFGVAKIIDSDLTNESVQCCNISQPILYKEFRNVTFQMCNFNGSRIIFSNFWKCNFYKMILGQVVFQQCNLSGTKFYHATWDTLVMIDCNLTDVVFKDFDEPSNKSFTTILLNCNITNTKFENYDLSKIQMIDCFELE